MNNLMKTLSQWITAVKRANTMLVIIRKKKQNFLLKLLFKEKKNPNW